jgi:lipid A 3-O-deacylase
MSFRSTLQRSLTTLLLIPLLIVGGTAGAATQYLDSLTPATLFLQAGSAGRKTQMYVAGATWDWGWHRQFSHGAMHGYWEVSFGRWVTDVGGGSSAWETQVGLTPVLRWQPKSAHNWFAEIGIGANLILPIYRSADKRFSTTFNFGDHLAIGRQFGAHHRHELALRLQHFSNGGIDQPNPGENFVQLRYSRQW